MEDAAKAVNLFVSSREAVFGVVGCLGPDTFWKLLCKGLILFSSIFLYISYLDVKVKTTSLYLDLQGCVFCPRFCMSLG